MVASDFNERIVTISEFHGVDQSKGVDNDDYSTSPDAVGFVSRHGELRVHGGVSAKYPAIPDSCSEIKQAFFRSSDTQEDVSFIMAFGGGNVYVLKGDAWQLLGSGFASDSWQGVNYRHEADDWFILTNGSNPLKYWNGADASLGDIAAKQGNEPIAFEHLTLLYERLWGAVYASAPDRIYWSESFAPEDWEVNYDTPDTGGGFLDVATFDGSRIRAIVAAFDDVLIFKDKSMHRLNGTYPGEFSLTQVYGSEGTLAYGTIVHTADRLYFLGADGLCVYNGMSVSSMAHGGDRKLKEIWKRLNTRAIHKAKACLRDDVIYLSVPLDGAEENSHVIEYDLKDGVYSVMEFAGVRDWLLQREGQKETLLCLIGNQIYVYDEGGTYCGRAIDACWTTPEIMLGTLTTKKKVGKVYMTVTAKAMDASRQPAMRLTLISGNKTRTKIVALKNGSNEVRKRIKIRGRKFRLRIENMNGDPLAVNRGMEIVLEEDSDL